LQILYINSISKNTWGGGEKWMLTAAKGLRKKGHQVCFCSRSNSIFLDKAKAQDFQTFPLDLRGDFDPYSIAELVKIIRREQVDIIFANFNKDVRLAGIAKRIAGRGIVIARNGLAILPNKLIYRLTYRFFADHILTNTNSIKNQYLQYGWLDDSFIKVIYNGINTSQRSDTVELDSSISLKISPNAPLIGFFGRFVGQKQPMKFLEVAKKINIRIPKAQFIMVGDGPLLDAVKNTILEYNLTDKVHLPGFLDDIQGLLNSCHLVLLTSYKEGLPNILMEAMLAEKAIIAFDVGGVRELIPSDNFGYVVSLNDVHSMSEKSITLLSDPPLIRRIGQQAAAHIHKNFSIEKMTEELDLFLHSLINR
jgi:glycosyltransferase involved in cell wall biosynthesis